MALAVAVLVLPTVPLARYNSVEDTQAAGWAIRSMQVGVIANVLRVGDHQVGARGVCWLAFMPLERIPAWLQRHRSSVIVER